MHYKIRERAMETREEHNSLSALENTIFYYI